MEVMALSNKRLFLVDAMSQIYRAYYAIRGLSTSGGLPTNAILGFTNILRRLITAEKPDYLGVVFDTPERTFRHEAYEKYKATRTAMPDDLSVQMPYIRRICEVLRVPMTGLAGYEADDIIGTFACQARERGLDVVIVTNDKDLCQLVDDHIKVLKTDRFGNIILMDAAAVEEKMGVRPIQIPDLLGLMGDTIDNIPGAPGVGEKGAKQIIQQYGSIEGALESVDKIERKTYRESLKNNADLVRQSRELATIMCDVPVELDLAALEYEEADRPAAYELFSELEFAQMIKEYADAAPGKQPSLPGRAPARISYSRITTEPDLSRVIEGLATIDRFAVAMAERKGSVYGIAFSPGAGEAVLVDLEKFQGSGQPLEMLRPLLQDDRVKKLIYDWKGCLTCLDRCARDNSNPAVRRAAADGCMVGFEPAIRIAGVEEDVMLSAYLVDPNRTNYRVPEIAREHLGIELAAEIDGFDSDDARALQAADFTFQLAEVLRAKMAGLDLEQVYTEIELPLVEILFEMEQIGVRVDIAQLHEAGIEIEKELSRLTGAIFGLAGQEFNINSTIQLGEIFEKLNIETGKKTKTGRVSTSFDVLEELAAKYELPKLIMEYRELSKLKSTYVDALPRLINPRTGRIHTSLNQAVAATGRLSSTNPNLQNIPIRSEMGRRIRAAFVPSPGFVMMSADYSQIELRIFAHITGDPVMTEAFQQGEDVHARTARAVFGAKTPEQEAEFRRVAKIVNFAIAYDIGPFGLAQRTGLSRAEARKVIDNYYQTYTGVRHYMEETPNLVRKSGLVRTIFGRIRPIPDIGNRNHNLRARAEREAINAPIQGTAADLVKIAMVRVYNRLVKEKLGARMILQVHDELLLEVPEGEVEQTSRAVREEMESVHEMTIPLVVDIGVGKNWMEAKP
jgi:DNA polymerase-1